MQNKLTFVVKWDDSDLDKVDFEVVNFEGREAISEHYEFTINLRSKDLPSRTNLLGKRATFSIQMSVFGQATEISNYHGLIYEFGNSGKIRDYYNYKVTLAPKLAKLKYTKNSDVFIKQSLGTIVDEIFNSHEFAEGERELAFDLWADKYQSGDKVYNRYNYVCQYEESDYNFINRILERDGVYYYFEQGEEQEKVIITDTKDKYLTRKDRVSFRHLSDQTVDLDANAINFIEVSSKLVPKKVTITNFGYEKAHLGDNGVITCSAFVGINNTEDRSLFGEEIIYGENFINPDFGGDGEFLASIRAQEIFCQSKIFTAKSTLNPISAGMKISLQDEKVPEFNGEYLVIEVLHKGYQQISELETTANNSPFYENTLVLIPAYVQYRPQRKSPWPKIHGTMNALIDAEGQSQYPQLDSNGRYKIRLPFLKRHKEDGKGSIWIRLATPYAGDSYGFHFPLHKGTEIVLSFRDGNPDMPVIMGAVFNSLHRNVVINKNAYMGGVLMTRESNILAMDDTNGAHAIAMATNNNWKYLQ